MLVHYIKQNPGIFVCTFSLAQSAVNHRFPHSLSRTLIFLYRINCRKKIKS